MNREEKYIDYLTGEVYKMLVLRERSDSGELVHLDDFINGLYIEINGANIWSEALRDNKNFVVVTSIIAYLSQNEINFKHFRREIFKMLGLLNKIRDELSR